MKYASPVDKLAQLLALQGVEVNRAAAAFNVAGKEYPAGSYAISLAQPERRLIRDVLDPQVSMDEAFLKGEEQRRRERQRSEIYDVTAWSLPLQFNVESIDERRDAKVAGKFRTPVKAGRHAAGQGDRTQSNGRLHGSLGHHRGSGQTAHRRVA